MQKTIPVARLGLLCLLGAAAAASANGPGGPAGPGLPNLRYAAAEVGKPLAMIKNREGHGSAAMHRGYLVIIFSKDGGLGAGGIDFLDIADPRKPKSVHLEDTPETQNIREPHGWGMRGDVACLQANEGMHFWDWSDVTKPKLLSYLKLPDIQISDYDKGMWWTCWQGRYVYGGGSGNGLYIVDAQDPAHPVFVKKIPVSATGGFRIGPTFAIGNLLVVTSTDISGYSTLDIGDPVNPRLLATVKAEISYAAMVNGNRILGAGSLADDGVVIVRDISNPAEIKLLGKSSPNMGDKGGYVMFSDGYAFTGFSGKGFAKVDLGKVGFPAASGGTAGIAGSDEDFATALGNLAFVGSDHIGGSSLIPHQAAPDSLGPWVNMVSPRDSAVKQPPTTRVGVTFTDLVDNATLDTANFKVRPLGGRALAGFYATQTGIVNFSPAEPLAPNTTYEVVVRSGGVKDYAGNPCPEAFRSVFSTGDKVATRIRAGGLSAAAPRARGLGPAPGRFPAARPGKDGALRDWRDAGGRLRLPGPAEGSGK